MTEPNNATVKKAVIAIIVLAIALAAWSYLSKSGEEAPAGQEPGIVAPGDLPPPPPIPAPEPPAPTGEPGAAAPAAPVGDAPAAAPAPADAAVPPPPMPEPPAPPAAPAPDISKGY